MPEPQFRKVLEGIGGAALMGLHILLPFLHAWRVRWGATDDELARAWLGDELVPHPRSGFTHAITIQAPVFSVSSMRAVSSIWSPTIIILADFSTGRLSLFFTSSMTLEINSVDSSTGRLIAAVRVLVISTPEIKGRSDFLT